jgi:DNA polymerase-3 subunit gamma/tau
VALALYRKYRPRTFAEVIGQEHVTEPLSQALRSGRLHHAYLFSGPRGCGKTSSARILARSLNCEQGPTPDPCGVCASCTSLANDGAGSIDVIEIDAASHGGVDDARELREKAFFAPANSRYKIYVIDEAQMVSSAGFNALLKLVEEPPDYVKFIFATTEPEKVLGTIRSRTHHYPFRLIPPAVLRPYLQQLTEAEGVHVEPAVFPLVVRAGGGSARDTLSVLDQLIAGAGPEGVSYPRAVALLGVTDVALIDEMCDALAAGDGAAAYQTIDRVAEAGHDPRRFASDLLERFRDLIVLQQVPDAVAKGLIDGPADQLEAMSAQATRLGPATLSRCADIVHNGLVEMRGTTAPRLLLELITARMLLPAADDTTGALLQRLERMERRLTLSADQPDGVRGPSGPEAPATVAAESSGGAGLSAARAAAAAAVRRSPAGIGSTARGSDGGSAPRAASPGADASAPAAEAAPVEAPRPDRDLAPQASDHSADRHGGPVPAVAADRHAEPVPAVAADRHTEPVPAAAADREPDRAAEIDGTPEPPAPSPAAERRPEPAGVLPDAPEEFAEPAASAAPGQLTAAAVREVWPEIIAAVGRQSKKVAALASGATVRDLDGQTVVLTFRFPAHAKMVADQPQLLVDALYEALGGRWQIRCEVAGEAGGVRAGSAAAGGGTGRGAPAPAAPAQAGPAQRPAAPAAPRAAASGTGGRAPGPQRQVPAPVADGDDGDDWPEPARPGGAAPATAAAPVPSGVAAAAGGPTGPAAVGGPAAGGVTGSAAVGGPAAGGVTGSAVAGGPAAAGGSGAAGGSAAAGGPGVAGGPAGSVAAGGPGAAGSPAGSAAAGGRISSAAAGVPTGPATAGGQTGSAATGGTSAGAGSSPGGVTSPASPGGTGAVADPRSAGRPGDSIPAPGATQGVSGATAVAAPRETGERPNGAPRAAAAPSSGLAAARAAAAASAARATQGTRVKPAKPATPATWSDGSPTEEAPYDPEFDGPASPDGSAPVYEGSAPVYEGFDPGDEPLDDVIDEKTARQSSEQQAVQLLRDAFGAEKISEL